MEVLLKVELHSSSQRSLFETREQRGRGRGGGGRREEGTHLEQTPTRDRAPPIHDVRYEPEGSELAACECVARAECWGEEPEDLQQGLEGWSRMRGRTGCDDFRNPHLPHPSLIPS